MSNGYNQPSPPPSRGGMPTWAKVLLGCGCLVVLIAIGVLVASYMGISWIANNPDVVGQKIAEQIIEQDPNLEVVKSENGKMTIRDKSTGQESTYDYSDIANGNFKIEGADGQTATITTEGSESGGVTVTGPDGQKVTYGADTSAADVPSFVPLYDKREEMNVGFRAEQGDKVTGILSMTSPDGFDAIKSWYDSRLKSDGFTVTLNETSFANQKGALIAGKRGDEVVNVTLASEDGGKVTIGIQYEGKK